MKIAFFAALAVVAVFIMMKVIGLYASMKPEPREESTPKDDEIVRDQAAWLAQLNAYRPKAIEEPYFEKPKPLRRAEPPKKLEAPPDGPRSEDEAIEKALSGMRFGGFD